MNSFAWRAAQDELMAAERADNPSIYAADIRKHLLTYAGHPPRHYRKVYDTWGPRNQQQTRVTCYGPESVSQDERAAQAAGHRALAQGRPHEAHQRKQQRHSQPESEHAACRVYSRVLGEEDTHGSGSRNEVGKSQGLTAERPAHTNPSVNISQRDNGQTSQGLAEATPRDRHTHDPVGEPQDEHQHRCQDNGTALTEALPPPKREVTNHKGGKAVNGER